MAEGTTEFKIKDCPDCLECTEILCVTVSWYDAQGHYGKATWNSDGTSTVYHTCSTTLKKLSVRHNPVFRAAAVQNINVGQEVIVFC